MNTTQANLYCEHQSGYFKIHPQDVKMQKYTKAKKDKKVKQQYYLYTSANFTMILSGDFELYPGPGFSALKFHSMIKLETHMCTCNDHLHTLGQNKKYHCFRRSGRVNFFFIMRPEAIVNKSTPQYSTNLTQSLLYIYLILYI